MDTQSTKFKIRLGLFVAAGTLLLFAAIFLIGKQKNLFNPVFQVNTTFSSVGGLQVGNNVRFSGINVGTVDKIEIINDSTVKVDMIIQKDVQPFIKVDSKVSIGSEGIIGDRVLVISQGSSDAPSVKSKQTLVSVEAVELDQIITSLNVSAKNAEVITAQLAVMMIKINGGEGTLGMLIHDTAIADNLSKTVLNFRETSNVLDQNMIVIMKEFNKTSENITKTSLQISEITSNINKGKGTLGSLINDTILAKDLKETVVGIKNSSQGLDRTLDALNSSILFRGHFKKKAKKEAEKQRLDSLELINTGMDSIVP